MRVNVRAYPASVRTEVGGRNGTSDPATLIVRVTTPAVDRRATVTVIDAITLAFAVKRSDVSPISGGRTATRKSWRGKAGRRKAGRRKAGRGEAATLTALLTR